MHTGNRHREIMPPAEARQLPLHRRPQHLVIVLVGALCVLAFSLACHLTTIHAQAMPGGQRSLAQTLLGDTRIAIGSQFYTQADVYFHRGVPHEHESAFREDPFQRIHAQVSPRQHTHLSGESDIREIMPWLDLATRADPQNLDGYLVAAFWLASEAKRPGLALEILNRAQRNIPYAYEVQLAKGRLHLHTGDHGLAQQAFDATLAFWEATADATKHDHLLDKAEALLYRALLREAAGITAGAIADLRTMLTITPHRPAMRTRLEQLEMGTPTQPPARDLLATLLRQYDARHRACEHEDHEHEAHDEEQAEGK